MRRAKALRAMFRREWVLGMMVLRVDVNVWRVGRGIVMVA